MRLHWVLVFISSFFILGCATSTTLPSSVIFGPIEGRKISVVGVNKQIYKIISEDLSKNKIFVGGAIEKEQMDICFNVTREKKSVPTYKNVIAVASLTLYPYQHAEEYKIVAGPCVGTFVEYGQATVSVQHAFGVLLFLYPFPTINSSETIGYAISTVIKSMISRNINKVSKFQYDINGELSLTRNIVSEVAFQRNSRSE